MKLAKILHHYIFHIKTENEYSPSKEENYNNYYYF